MVNIGRKRPPMDDEVLAKRSATVRRLLRGLIASAGFSAEVALSHLEEDEHRFIQVTITLLSQHGQGQLFDQQYGTEEIESLPKRLIEAGNAALHRFISSQRMSLSALSQLYKGVERANQGDMRIVSALQDLPGRSIRFVDASGPFTLARSGVEANHDRRAPGTRQLQDPYGGPTMCRARRNALRGRSIRFDLEARFSPGHSTSDP
jgi:hypothetical protein